MYYNDGQHYEEGKCFGFWFYNASLKLNSARMLQCKKGPKCSCVNPGRCAAKIDGMCMKGGSLSITVQVLVH